MLVLQELYLKGNCVCYVIHTCDIDTFRFKGKLRLTSSKSKISLIKDTMHSTFSIQFNSKFINFIKQ